MNLDIEERGMPSTVMDGEELRQLVEDNPCTVIPVRAQKLGVNIGTVSGYLSRSASQVGTTRIEQKSKSVTKFSLRFLDRNQSTSLSRSSTERKLW